MSDRYERMGATGKEEGLYVRFDPGFGLNVYIGHRLDVGKLAWKGRDFQDRKEFGMSIQGWDKICQFVDEWRERNGN